MKDRVRKRVIYHGRVQGVGFRYTVQGLATEFPVGGFVRNLPNGDVELAAEGTAGQVEALLEAISHRMAGNIERTTITESVPEGLTDFHIRF